MKAIPKKISTPHKLWILVPLIVLIVAMTGCSTNMSRQWVQAQGEMYDTTGNCSAEGDPVAYPGWHTLLDVDQSLVEGLGIWDSNFTGFYTVLWGDFGSPAITLPYNGKIISPKKLELTIDYAVNNTTFKGKIYLNAESFLFYYPLVPPWQWFYVITDTSLNPDIESWIAKYEDGVCKEKVVLSTWIGTLPATSAAEFKQELEDAGIEVPPDIDLSKMFESDAVDAGETAE